MAEEVIHISEAEAVSDFSSILSRVRAGAEVVIEADAKPIALVVSPAVRSGRLLSEAIAMAEACGSTVTVDKDFARDLEDVINRHREPLQF